MLRTLLVLSFVFSLGFTKVSESDDNSSLEGSASSISSIPGDDEDIDNEVSGSGDSDLIASPIANETISINITSDDQKDNNVSYTYEDEPEVEYVDNYDNGSNSTISIDMRKDETNENFDTLPSEDTKDKENIEIEEKVEIEVDDDLQPEIEKSVEKVENEMTDEIDVAKGTQDDTYNLETKKNKNENENKIENTELTNPDPVEPDQPQSASLLNNNQFLAAIIVGGCVGLLLAICVIAVFAYRLKKKDEGSYSLDDQKKLSPNYQYTQGQEYYASETQTLAEENPQGN